MKSTRPYGSVVVQMSAFKTEKKKPVKPQVLRLVGSDFESLTGHRLDFSVINGLS
jgi:hypothetical protein